MGRVRGHGAWEVIRRWVGNITKLMHHGGCVIPELPTLIGVPLVTGAHLELLPVVVQLQTLVAHLVADFLNFQTFARKLKRDACALSS